MHNQSILNFQFFPHSLGIQMSKCYASLHYVTKDSDTILAGVEKNTKC